MCFIFSAVAKVRKNHERVVFMFEEWKQLVKCFIDSLHGIVLNFGEQKVILMLNELIDRNPDSFHTVRNLEPNFWELAFFDSFAVEKSRFLFRHERNFVF